MGRDFKSDDRLAEAQAIPLLEIADKLGLVLRQITATESAGPCPDCGGNDRFSINKQKQVFGCRKCGAGGDGLALVQLAIGCSFPDALSYLVGEAEVEISPEEKRRRAEKRAAQERTREDLAAQERARAINDARRIWASARDHDTARAAEYLAGRGIVFEAWPQSLRFLPDHAYRVRRGGAVVELHRGPCMIAAIVGPDGHGRAVHQTWIDPEEPGRKAAIFEPDGSLASAKLVRGSKKGGAIRLTGVPEPGGCLVMGEGIETTASAMVAGAVPGAAYWAGVDLGNMAGVQIKAPGVRNSGVPAPDPRAFVPPDWIARLVYLQDGDSDHDATRAKLLSGLRRAMAQNPALRGEIVAAPPGQDFNDILRGSDAADAAAGDLGGGEGGDL